MSCDIELSDRNIGVGIARIIISGGIYLIFRLIVLIIFILIYFKLFIRIPVGIPITIIIISPLTILARVDMISIVVSDQ